MCKPSTIYKPPIVRAVFGFMYFINMLLETLVSRDHAVFAKSKTIT